MADEDDDRARLLGLLGLQRVPDAPQENIIGTFADNGRIIQNADGTRQAVSAGGSTNDPATIERIMAGDSFAAVAQDNLDQQRIAENPIAARGSEFVRGVPLLAFGWRSQLRCTVVLLP